MGKSSHITGTCSRATLICGHLIFLCVELPNYHAQTHPRFTYLATYRPVLMWCNYGQFINYGVPPKFAKVMLLFPAALACGPGRVRTQVDSSVNVF